MRDILLFGRTQQVSLTEGWGLWLEIKECSVGWWLTSLTFCNKKRDNAIMGHLKMACILKNKWNYPAALLDDLHRNLVQNFKKGEKKRTIKVLKKPQNLKGTTEIRNNFFEMFPRHNILGKAKAQEGLETKHHESAFELFTDKMKGHDRNLHVVLHPKEKLCIFYCTYALKLCLLAATCSFSEFFTSSHAYHSDLSLL